VRKVLRFNLHPTSIDNCLVLRVYGRVCRCETAVDRAVESPTKSFSGALYFISRLLTKIMNIIDLREFHAQRL
jgi:hypothetical protein